MSQCLINVGRQWLSGGGFFADGNNLLGKSVLRRGGELLGSGGISNCLQGSISDTLGSGSSEVDHLPQLCSGC